MTIYSEFSKAFASEITSLANDGLAAEPITDPSSPASNYGANPRPSIELLGTSFTISSCQSTIFTCAEIPFDLTYGIGLLLWCLSGSNDQEFISYYRGKPPTGKKISFGHRMLHADGKHDLLSLAMQRIEKDPGTRRGYVPIFQVDDLFKRGEIPCAIGFHLHQRSGVLHGVTMMRAQNAITALPMDVFIFSSLLRHMAAKANVLEGTYTHMCSTFHAFTDDISRIGSLLKGDSSAVSCHELGSMHGFSDDLFSLLLLEKRLRVAVAGNDTADVQAISNSPLPYRSEAGVAVGACLTSVAMRRIGARAWTHQAIGTALASLIN